MLKFIPIIGALELKSASCPLILNGEKGREKIPLLFSLPFKIITIILFWHSHPANILS
jgi:hypothetical protein